MSNVPKSPEEILDTFRADAEATFKDTLVSIALYGSAAKGEYVPKKSDINFLIVLTEEGIQNLSSAFGLIKKWQKRRVATPLFVTKHYIESSLDSFPIEFLNMKNAYRILMGEDILNELEIPKKFVRLECEGQIKGKLLHLRREFLATRGKGKAIRELLSVTVPTFTSLFTAMLYLKDLDPPSHRDDVMRLAATEFGLDQIVFDRVLAVRHGEKLSEDELIQLTEQYINVIRECAMIVDKL